MKKLKILRILLSLGETSGPYNILSLPLADKQDITICTYFKSPVTVVKNICLIDGNGSLTGFFRGLKTAFCQEEYDIVHAHTPHVSFLHLLFTLFITRKPKIPKALTLHCSYGNLKLRNKVLLIPVFSLFERIIFCSESSRRSFPSYFLKLANKRVRVIKNGVDLKRIDCYIKEKPDLSERSNFGIVSIGRLIESKNYSVLLNSYKKIHDDNDNLTIIGEGHLSGMLLKNIGEIGLQSYIKLTGLIPRNDVFKRLGKASLFVSASIREGLPIAVLEAMACRCPVILSDIPPHREIADGVDFIPLIAPNDADGFAREIKRIKDMSHSERVELGEKCRKLIEERFSLATMHEGYAKVYREIIRS